jgi:hypothetical protein
LLSGQLIQSGGKPHAFQNLAEIRSRFEQRASVLEWARLAAALDAG